MLNIEHFIKEMSPEINLKVRQPTVKHNPIIRICNCGNKFKVNFHRHIINKKPITCNKCGVTVDA